MTNEISTLPERVRKRIVVDPSGCWLWQGSTNQKGHGISQFYGYTTTAHRVVYQLFHGILPRGDDLHHFCCANKNCCNPGHVTPMTHGEHLALRRLVRTHCKQGHAFTPENTYTGTWGRNAGVRFCRTCLRAMNREYKKRKHKLNTF